MRTINLPDVTRFIENDSLLEKLIRAELNNINLDPHCNFQFDQHANPYHVKRFTDVANKVNWWLETYNREGRVTVTVYTPPTPVEPEQIIEETPVTGSLRDPEVVKMAIDAVIQEPTPTKKKKNG